MTATNVWEDDSGQWFAAVPNGPGTTPERNAQRARGAIRRALRARGYDDPIEVEVDEERATATVYRDVS